METAMGNVNDQRSKHLFLDKFPLEIATLIFSFLRQDDCVTCMSVCQQWYTIVPQCSRGVWKDLCIPGTDTRVNDARWRLCIGEHVQSVKFYKIREDMYLYNAMQKLINAECNQIKNLAFDECITTVYPHHFYMLLGQLAKSTIELTFRQHSHGLCLNHVLTLCPKLTYLLFKGSVYEYVPDLQDIYFPVDPRVEFTNLTHLFVDVTEHRVKEKLVPIIQRCPNLRYFGYNIIYLTEFLLPDIEVIDLEEIFSLCPKLVYLEMNSEEFLRYRDTRSFDPIHISKSNDASGLRFFTARETIHCGIDKLGHYIMQSADALEYLCIYGRGNDWTSVLKRLRFPRLRILAFRNITYEDGTMDMLLGHFPALEDLSIMCSGNANLHILRTLQVLPHLKRLELNGISLDYNNNTSSGSTAQFDQQAASNKSILQEIHFGSSHPITDVLLQELPWLRSLKYVMMTLSYRAGPQCTDGALCRFIEQLKQTKIETLHLFGLQNLPPAAIRAIGESPTLQRIALNSLYNGIEIDVADLLYMLRTNKTLGSANVVGLKLLGTEDDDAAFEQIRSLGFELTKRCRYGLYDLYLTNK